MPEALLLRRPPAVIPSRFVELLPAAERYVLRGDEAVRAAAERAFGCEIPSQACRAGATGPRAALWLGPDEWLLITPEGSAAATLQAALAPLPHSLVEVSHRQCALTVSGPAAETLLAAGCPLDLDATAFPVGMCTRTLIGKTEVTLWRTAPEEFRVEVWRSFVAYLTGFLAEAERGII